MGNTQNLFYYRDQNGQKLGPLPLSEIDRFVKAGVLPENVMVREVERNSWRTLDDLVINATLVEATTVSASSTSAGSANSTSGTAAKSRLRKPSRKFFGESVAGWMGCAAALIGGTVFYLFLLIPIFKLMEWFYDTFVGAAF